MFLVFKSLKS